MKSFFRKIGQQASRLAALFHYFSGETGDISPEAMDAAITVCEWYVLECIRVFMRYTQPEPQRMDAAQSLLQWLQEATAEPWRYPKLTPHRYTERDLRNYSCIRNDPLGLEIAINSLHSQGQISVETGPKGGRIIYFPYWKAPASCPVSAAFPDQAAPPVFGQPVNAAPVSAAPNPWLHAHQMRANNIDNQTNDLRKEVSASVASEDQPDVEGHYGGIELDTDEIRAVKRQIQQSAIEAGLGNVTLSMKFRRR